MLWGTKRKLRSANPQVREAAVRQLAPGGEPGLVELVVPALDDPSSGVRRAAVEVLAKSASASVRARLVSKLSDKDARVRLAAADALARFGWQPEDGRAQLQFAVACKNWEEVVQFGEPGVKALLELAGNLDDRDLADQARDTLASHGDAAMEALVRILREDLNAGLRERIGLTAVVAGVEALGRRGDTRAIPVLADELKRFAHDWNIMAQDESTSLREGIDLIYQKAIWETVVALISCGESGIAALVESTKAAEVTLREHYFRPLDQPIPGFPRSREGDSSALYHAEAQHDIARCQLEAMVYAPLAALQLKIAPVTPASNLAERALLEVRKFARIDYNVPRVLNIVSSFAGVPVTPEMLR